MGIENYWRVTFWLYDSKPNFDLETGKITGKSVGLIDRKMSTCRPSINFGINVGEPFYSSGGNLEEIQRVLKRFEEAELDGILGYIRNPVDAGLRFWGLKSSKLDIHLRERTWGKFWGKYKRLSDFKDDKIIEIRSNDFLEFCGKSNYYALVTSLEYQS